MEKMRKNTKNRIHGSGSDDRDLNPGPPAYEIGALLP